VLCAAFAIAGILVAANQLGAEAAQDIKTASAATCSWSSSPRSEPSASWCLAADAVTTAIAGSRPPPLAPRRHAQL